MNAFFIKYKQLDKLCREIYNSDQGVTNYIDDMLSKPDGENRVVGWEGDLAQLKHYRWVRNQIAHEDVNEEDLYTDEDVEWIEDFIVRIYQQKDPLAFYRKAKEPKTSKPKTHIKDEWLQTDWNCNTESYQNVELRKGSGVIGIVAAVITIVIVVLIALIFIGN